jgi:hypothetical protein
LASAPIFLVSFVLALTLHRSRANFQ